MKWERDMEGVRKEFVGGEWVPEPISPLWENRCWTCRFASVSSFFAVTCTVTGRRMIPCAECDVPSDPPAQKIA